MAEVLRPYLLKLAEGRQPDDLLFAGRPAAVIKGRRRSRGLEKSARPTDWLRRQVWEVCKLAGIPKVGPHGLRGTHASLAAEAGASAEVVSAALGHTSSSITRSAYAMPGSFESGAAKRVGTLLAVETFGPKGVSTGKSAA